MVRVSYKLVVEVTVAMPVVTNAYGICIMCISVLLELVHIVTTSVSNTDGMVVNGVLLENTSKLRTVRSDIWR